MTFGSGIFNPGSGGGGGGGPTIPSTYTWTLNYGINISSIVAQSSVTFGGTFIDTNTFHYTSSGTIDGAITVGSFTALGSITSTTSVVTATLTASSINDTGWENVSSGTVTNEWRGNTLTATNNVQIGNANSYYNSNLLTSPGTTVGDTGNALLLTDSSGVNGRQARMSSLIVAATNVSAPLAYITNTGSASLVALDLPTGTLTTNGAKVGLVISTYSPTGSYNFTATSATIAVATSSSTITLTSSGTYRIDGLVNLRYSGATFAANQFVTMNLYRQNNTPGVIANSQTQEETGVVTSITSQFGQYNLAPIFYTTTNTNDVISMQGSISATPGAGNFQATEADLTAMRLY